MTAVVFVDPSRGSLLLEDGTWRNVSVAEAWRIAVEICRGGAPIAPAPAPPRQPKEAS